MEELKGFIDFKENDSLRPKWSKNQNITNNEFIVKEFKYNNKIVIYFEYRDYKQDFKATWDHYEVYKRKVIWDSNDYIFNMNEQSIKEIINKIKEIIPYKLKLL